MGMITDIQRFSLNDGPGIRTTVFFKGCNMDCAWCHNPETRSSKPEILVYKDKCVHCGACIGFDAAKATDGMPPARDVLTVGKAASCYSGALMIDGHEASVDEIMTEVMQDKDYYDRSSGGLTLSGGEVMMQPAFAKEILVRAKAAGIHTAIETNLAYSFGYVDALRGTLDLIMADIKLMDNDGHKRWTGIGNEQILQNLRMLCTIGVPAIIRTPVIPGVNDNIDEISAITHWIASNVENVLYYELLNYNPLGHTKYIALGLENPFASTKPLSDDVMSKLAQAASCAGIPVRVG